MRAIHAMTATAALTAASGALAGTVALHHNIRQGTQSGFGFSVLHSPRNDSGSGHILFRYLGSMDTVYDDAASTLTFTRFEADLFRESDLNANTLGAGVGSLSLVSGLLNINPTTNLIGGSLTLHLTLDGVGAGDATFLFRPIAYNALANRWDPERFSFGLWGATADVFGQESGEHDQDDQIYGLGMDLMGDGGVPMVPLPSGVALGAVGLGGLFGVRRRRCV